MKKHLSRILRLFVPLAVVTTLMAGLVYVAVQQNYRQNANDPQIQIAEDLARQISAASSIPQISPGLTTDISQSLGSFVLIYDDSNKFVTGSGQVNGQYPVLPAGVFANVRKSGEDRLTWEPAPGTRVALVVTRYDNSTHSGFVAVGRSLREVEKRIDMLCLYVIAAWLVALVASFVLIAAVEMLSDRHYDPVV